MDGVLRGGAIPEYAIRESEGLSAVGTVELRERGRVS
jgi:hypothetical protein